MHDSHIHEQPMLRDEAPQGRTEVPPAASVKRPARWSPSNWPVHWKVLAIVLIPTLLAVGLGGLRVYHSVAKAGDLRLAADRAEMVRPVEQYLAALENALLAYSTGGDPNAAQSNFNNAGTQLQNQVGGTDVGSDVKTEITRIIDEGSQLLDQVASNSIGLFERVTSYVPILLTAQHAISDSVRLDDDVVHAQVEGLDHAVGARGQMLMQRLLVNQNGAVPPPEVRTALLTLQGNEPTNVFGIDRVLGEGSEDANSLQDEFVTRVGIVSDPASALVGNPQLLQSIQATDTIARKVIDQTSSSVIAAMLDKASAARTAAIRDTAIVLAAIVAALALMFLAARSLVMPLHRLRTAALRVTHEDLPAEVARVQAGEQPPPITPVPVSTTEEIGQVAHTVDELHAQALQLAVEQTGLQAQVSDMFETLSRRNRSLVEAQLALIDDLERNEESPQRLDALFKLDHLAARMRRNGANLLVLSGAKAQRAGSSEQTAAMPVVSIVHAAASQVEDYQRVVTANVADSEIVGAAAGDVAHILAELLDNGLRHSPPTTRVQVSAFRSDNGGLVIEVGDAGLGMTETDLRMANTRLESGGEVTPHTARHMGLFVVGRLAQRHRLTVQLRSSRAGDPRSGTTVIVSVPIELIDGAIPAAVETPDQGFRERFVAEAALEHPPVATSTQSQRTADLPSPPYLNGSGHQEPSALPRRSPGTSGIVATPEAVPEPAGGPTQESDVPRPPSTPVDDDPIFQRLMSETSVDPTALMEPMQPWQSVWDDGWAAAAHAEEAPVTERTEEGLPLRQPGARLVPGSVEGAIGAAHRQPDNDDGLSPATEEPVVRRDPDAVRASLSSHLGGVRAARSHARHARPETTDE